MGEIIREAGWGIYPVVLFGGAMLVVGLRHLATPRRSLFNLAVGFSVATLLAGMLGAATGIQATVQHVTRLSGAGEGLFLVGLRESLHNLVAALVLVCVNALVLTAGRYTALRREERARQAAIQ